MGTPGVKRGKLFLKYLHPWSPVFLRDPLSGRLSGWLLGD